MNAILLSCKDATRIASEKAYRQLRFRERVQLKMHKSLCHACRKFDEENEFIEIAVHRHIEKNQNNLNIGLPEDHKARIQTMLNRLMGQ